MSGKLIGVAVSGADTPEVLGRIGRCEQAGIPAVWLTTGGARPDSLTTFAAAAVQTESIKFGTSIVPTFPRHPLVSVGYGLQYGAAGAGHRPACARTVPAGGGTKPPAPDADYGGEGRALLWGSPFAVPPSPRHSRVSRPRTTKQRESNATRNYVSSACGQRTRGR